MNLKNIFVFAFSFGLFFTSMGQPLLKDKKIQFSLNDSGDHYVRLTFLNQTWLRYTETNPGSYVFGQEVGNIYDVGLRRTRIQLYGRLTDRVFFYMQFGQNNFSYNSPKFTGSFFHDVISEYRIGKYLELGAGLTGWSGLSRYASPSVGSIMSLDAPLYQQATNSVSDQFLRKLSIYAKGQIGNIDYRFALTQPMAIQSSTAPVGGISEQSEFAPYKGLLQSQGYIKYQLLDTESNLTPYSAGTYLGSKQVLCLGLGFISQNDAMWHQESTGDTSFTDMLLLGADLFFETAINDDKNNGVINLYVAYNQFDFGGDYLRNVGVMNPANGVGSDGTIGGAGNAFPMIGTGATLYIQAGYCLPSGIVQGDGRLQVYAAMQRSDFDYLDDIMLMYEGGINWYIHGKHSEKISLNYQSRPIFELDLASLERIPTLRRGMVQLQYQISI